MNKSWDYFSKVYILGGNIPQNTFIKYYDEPYENLQMNFLLLVLKKYF